MFKSRSIAINLAKGVAGFTFLWVTLHYASQLGWWDLAPAAAALACFKGCPMCWTVGLVETVMGRGGSCVDGSCSN